MTDQLPTRSSRAARLAALVRRRFGPAANQIGYARDDHGVVLWDVRDAAGELLWTADADDIPGWRDLGDVVDRFAPLVEDDPQRGDALVFDLALQERAT